MPAKPVQRARKRVGLRPSYHHFDKVLRTHRVEGLLCLDLRNDEQDVRDLHGSIDAWKKTKVEQTEADIEKRTEFVNHVVIVFL